MDEDRVGYRTNEQSTDLKPYGEKDLLRKFNGKRLYSLFITQLVQ